MSNGNVSPGRYYGTLQRSRIFEKITISETVYANFEKQPVHYHDNPYITFMMNGVMDDSTGANHITAREHDIIFHPSRTEHNCTFLNPAVRCFFVEFDQNWFNSLAMIGACLHKTGKYRLSKMHGLLMRLHEALVYDSTFSALLVEGVSLQLLAEMGEKEQKYYHHPKWIRKVTEILHDGRMKDMSLSCLAKECGCSIEHLSRSFKKSTGYTISEYLLTIKIKKASSLLVSTDLSITQVAEKTGFYDTSHFTRCFKRFEGTTPSAFRMR
jgi:AraC family transcriptional regulator